jgi:hypothetical protein
MHYNLFYCLSSILLCALYSWSYGYIKMLKRGGPKSSPSHIYIDIFLHSIYAQNLESIFPVHEKQRTSPRIHHASRIRALAFFILGTEPSWRSEERYSVLKLDKLHNLKVPAVRWEKRIRRTYVWLNINIIYVYIYTCT